MPQAQNSTETIALVFTDLVGSTELMSQLEPDRADRVRRDHFARLQASVDRAARRTGVGLSVRIGVAAGDVLMENGDCFGAPVVEGARLCDLARGGQILATDIVGRMASGRSKAQLAALETVKLKGLPEPVAVLEVAWSASSDPRGLLERADDLELVMRAFEGAARGEGQVVVVE